MEASIPNLLQTAMMVFSSSHTYQRTLYKRSNISTFPSTTFDPLTTKTRADLLEAAQIEDGVADQLTRPVKGDESTSVGLVNLSPKQPEAV